MKTVYVVVFLLALLVCGCNMSSRQAEDVMLRTHQLQSDIAAAEYKSDLLTNRLVQTVTRRQHFAEAKLNIALAEPDAAKRELMFKELDALMAKEDKSGVFRDNERDKISFLNVQSERLNALMNTTDVFVSGKKTMLTMLAEKIQKEQESSAAEKKAAELKAAGDDLMNTINATPPIGTKAPPVIPKSATMPR